MSKTFIDRARDYEAAAARCRRNVRKLDWLLTPTVCIILEVESPGSVARAEAHVEEILTQARRYERRARRLRRLVR